MEITQDTILSTCIAVKVNRRHLKTGLHYVRFLVNGPKCIGSFLQSHSKYSPGTTIALMSLSPTGIVFNSLTCGELNSSLTTEQQQKKGSIPNRSSKTFLTCLHSSQIKITA